MIMMFIMDVYLQLLEYLIFVEDVFEYFNLYFCLEFCWIFQLKSF